MSYKVEVGASDKRLPKASHFLTYTVLNRILLFSERMAYD